MNFLIWKKKFKHRKGIGIPETYSKITGSLLCQKIVFLLRCLSTIIILHLSADAVVASRDDRVIAPRAATLQSNVCFESLCFIMTTAPTVLKHNFNLFSRSCWTWIFIIPLALISETWRHLRQIRLGWAMNMFSSFFSPSSLSSPSLWLSSLLLSSSSSSSFLNDKQRWKDKMCAG